MNLSAQLIDLSYPLAQSLGLAGLGLAGLSLHRYRTAVALFSMAALWLGLCATPAFAAWLQHGLEDQYPQRTASAYPTADAIVVLGGAPYPHAEADWTNDSPSVLKSRLGFGFQLYMHARAPVILLSGGGGDAVAMAHQLARQGISPSAMRLETRSRDTHENAAFSAAILKREGRRHILLVTSSMHMPRAAASFRRQGLQVIPAPALDLSAPAKQAPTRWRPQAVLLRSARSLREYLGLLYYKLRGWA
jgi:uncharacterized SAM-binding protein YcdF (DUF218 family)